MPGVEVLTSLDDVEAIRDDWSALADVVDARIFTRPEWCLPWWRHLGRGRLLVIAARRESRLVALAPFHVRPRAGLGLVRFLGHGLGTVGSILVRPGEEDILPAVWDAAIGPRRRVLQLLDHEAGGAGITALAARTPASVSMLPRDVCPVISLPPPGGPPAKVGGQRVRRTLSRSRRLLADQDLPMSVECGRDLTAVRALLDDTLAIYGRAEAAHPRLHVLQEPWAPFAHALMAEAAAADRLRLILVRMGGRPAAFVIGLRGGTSMNYWLPRFDPAFGAFSPGHFGIEALVGESLSMGLGEVDLGLGDSEYKRQWSTGEYRTLTVTGAGTSWAARAQQVVEASTAGARRWLRPERRANMAG